VSETIHKEVVCRFYEEVWNRHGLTRLGDILAPHFSFRGSLGPELTGHAAFAAYVDALHASLAEYPCEILELVGEGEKVVARMRFHGLHRGPLLRFCADRRARGMDGQRPFRLADANRSVGARRPSWAD
jgi:predicted ester cyclase